MGSCIIACSSEPRVESDKDKKQILENREMVYRDEIVKQLADLSNHVQSTQICTLQYQKGTDIIQKTNDLQESSHISNERSSLHRKSRFCPRKNRTQYPNSKGRSRFASQLPKLLNQILSIKSLNSIKSGTPPPQKNEQISKKRLSHNRHHNHNPTIKIKIIEQQQNKSAKNQWQEQFCKSYSQRDRKRGMTEFLPLKRTENQYQDPWISDFNLSDKSSRGRLSITKNQDYLEHHLLPEVGMNPLNSIDSDLIQSTKIFQRIKSLSQDIHFQDGSHYVGEWQDGMKNGKGKLVWNGGVYEGRWKDNEMSGQGKIIFENGEVFEGNFVHHKAQGHGTFYFKDESVYRGNWRHNKQNGHGVQEWPNNEHYTGNWVEGSKEGYGELVYADGSFYKGLFKENEWHGEGEYEWSGNQHYKGHWEHNKKEGRGRLVFASGEVHEGDFSNNKMHGQGKLTLKDGTVHEGLWEHGKKEGTVKETTPDGQTKAGFWIFGKLAYYYP